MNTLIPTSFRPDFADMKFLFLRSWQLIQAHPVLRKPVYSLFWLRIIWGIIVSSLLFGTAIYIIISLFLSSLYMEGTDASVDTTISLAQFIPVAIVIGLIFLISYPLVMMFETKYQAQLALMIYKIENEEAFTEQDIVLEVQSVNIKLREITWASIFQKILDATVRGKGGVFKVIVSIFLSTLEEVWDLMQNYMVPAVVIEKMDSWSAIIEKFKSLQTKIPATLVGVFGIDMGSSAFGWIFGILKFLLLLIGGLLAYGLFLVGVSWYIWILPIVLVLMLGSIASQMKDVFFRAVKTMYFTLLYAILNHPEILDKNPSMKEYLTFSGKH